MAAGHTASDDPDFVDVEANWIVVQGDPSECDARPDDNESHTGAWVRVEASGPGEHEHGRRCERSAKAPD
ncbi:MAG: hypothetical protein OEX04_02140 [Acidimicrobiia bacterium]|nr:hypothetical protein [Acidimicrobiia bacterium]MDH4306257.1 hypothetical protein [Acidimicrobiia bacterium]MDH5292413.1 hypothetical protein [Acidimicrobiia bacterium]